MSRIEKKFQELKVKGAKALVTFITAGDPDLAMTEECILAMEEGGADIVELGVPFSDPMADGPTIQKSSERALLAGTSLAKILVMVKSVRYRTEIPIILMGYYNPMFRYGVASFVRDAAAAGVDGILLVDLPPEEASGLKKLAAAVNLDIISLLTPTSDRQRIEKATGTCSGFIYYVSVAGVTGSRSAVSDTIAGKVSEIRKCTSTPIVVGFGVSDAAQAAQVAALADGVVIGSAIVKLFEEFTGDKLKKNITSFIAGVRSKMST